MLNRLENDVRSDMNVSYALKYETCNFCPHNKMLGYYSNKHFKRQRRSLWSGIKTAPYSVIFIVHWRIISSASKNVEICITQPVKEPLEQAKYV